jgi:hypothetical protein
MTDLAPYRQQAGDLDADQRDADEALGHLRELAIANSNDQAFASEILLDVKAKHSELEKRRKSVVQPLNGVIRTVNGWFKPVRDRLEEAERILKGKIAEYLEAQERANEEALQAAADAETGEEASSALAQVAPVTTAPGTSTRKVWRWEIVNTDAVPREFLTVDEQALAKYVRAAKESGGAPYGIPGIRFYQETKIVAKR